MPPRRRTQEETNAEVRAENPNQHLVDLLVEALHNRPPNPVEAPRPTTFREFKLVGPPEFKGSAEPIEAQIWITEMEKFFLLTTVADDQKTIFATFFLKGEANYWWEANKTRAGEGIIAWDRFKELFLATYFPQATQDRMEIRFLELKQGDMTVSQYTTKFNELARFAPHQVDTEARKVRRFEEGLKPQIRRGLAVLQIKTFEGILEKAIIAENENEALAKFHQEKKKEGGTSNNNNNKRKWDATSSNNQGKGGGNNYNNNKRNNNNHNSNPNRNNNHNQGVAPCKICGKIHRGECL